MICLTPNGEPFAVTSHTHAHFAHRDRGPGLGRQHRLRVGTEDSSVSHPQSPGDRVQHGAGSDPVAQLNEPAAARRGHSREERSIRLPDVSALSSRRADRLAGPGLLEDELPGSTDQSDEPARDLLQRRGFGWMGPGRAGAGVRRAGSETGLHLLHARAISVRRPAVRTQRHLCVVPRLRSDTQRARALRRQRLPERQRHDDVWAGVYDGSPEPIRTSMGRMVRHRHSPRGPGTWGTRLPPTRPIWRRW